MVKCKLNTVKNATTETETMETDVVKNVKFNQDGIVTPADALLTTAMA